MKEVTNKKGEIFWAFLEEHINNPDEITVNTPFCLKLKDGELDPRYYGKKMKKDGAESTSILRR